MELDFSRQLHYFWALMPEMILCAWGMVVLIAGVSGKHKDPETASSGDPSFGGSADLGWLRPGRCAARRDGEWLALRPH